MRNTRKTCLFMITLSAILVLMFTLATAVYAEESLEPVEYQEASWDDTNKQVVYTTKSISTYTKITSEMDTAFQEGWYVVDSIVTIEDRIVVSDKVNLILCDGCTLTAKKGINVARNNALQIYSQIAGTGELVATNVDTSVDYKSAAIGNMSNGVSGDITIHGGVVTATAVTGAGIGGGNGASAGTIKIFGGTVTASTSSGAGIGGGQEGSGGDITIAGGTVTASSGYGAGIGSGEWKSGGTIKILGGTVTARSKNGAGIGGGQECSAEAIEIDDGTVTATSSNGAGIGAGSRGGGGNITINGGMVTAAGDQGAGIGGGEWSSGGAITINGGLVSASGWGGAGIGGGYEGSGGTTTINGGTVIAWTSRGKAFGGGYEGGDGALTVADGLIVYGGDDDYPRTAIAKSGDSYPRFRCMTVDCQHEFNYRFISSENSSSIFAECSKDICSLPDGMTTLTIAAPERTVYGDTDKSAEATLTGLRVFRSVTGVNVGDIMYSGRGETIYDSSDPPEAAGDYIAKVTINDNEPYTLSVYYTITLPDLVPPSSWSGLGTEEEPFVISTKDGWDALAELVRGGYTMEGLFFKLGENIEVTDMVGAFYRPFSGSFDGDGHTLTFNADDAPGMCAPFVYAEDAEFMNLHIAGTIKTSNQFAAGLIGRFDGTVKVTNCQCSIVIDSSVNGDGTHGGFIAVGEQNGAACFEGCAFDGKLLGPDTTKCGGFIGWANPTDKIYTVKNCLFAPEELTLRSGLFNFIRNVPGSAIIQNSYYTKSIGDNSQGVFVRTIKADEGITIGSKNPIEYKVSGITAYGTGLACGDAFYAGKDEVIAVTSASVRNMIIASAGTLSGGVVSYTLTMPDEDVHLSLKEVPVDSNVPVVKTSKIKTTGNIKKKQMKVEFPASKKVDKYLIQYRMAGQKSWKNIWITGKNTFVIKGLKRYSLSQFRIAGYAKKKDGTWVCGKWSKVSYRYMNSVPLKTAKAGKKSIKVTWKKDKKATGYQIQYSLKKSMAKAKTKTVKGKSKTKYTIKGLKKGKKYYIKVRPIKKKSGKTYLGILSKAKTARPR